MIYGTETSTCTQRVPWDAIRRIYGHCNWPNHSGQAWWPSLRRGATTTPTEIEETPPGGLCWRRSRRPKPETRSSAEGGQDRQSPSRNSLPIQQGRRKTELKEERRRRRKRQREQEAREEGRTKEMKIIVRKYIYSFITVKATSTRDY